LATSVKKIVLGTSPPEFYLEGCFSLANLLFTRYDSTKYAGEGNFQKIRHVTFKELRNRSGVSFMDQTFRNSAPKDRPKAQAHKGHIASERITAKTEASNNFKKLAI